MKQPSKLVYLAYGIIKDLDTASPLSDLTVQVFDKDFLGQQYLGEGRTSIHGRYEVRFTQADFNRICPIERLPDVFIRVYASDGELLYSSPQSFLLNHGLKTRIDGKVNLPDKRPVLPEKPTFLGEVVDVDAAAKLTNDELLDAYLMANFPGLQLASTEKVLSAFPYLQPYVHAEPVQRPKDLCGEPAGRSITYFLKERGIYKRILSYQQILILLSSRIIFLNTIVQHELKTTRFLIRYGISPGTNSQFINDLALALPDALEPLAMVAGQYVPPFVNGASRPVFADFNLLNAYYGLPDDDNNDENHPIFIQQLGHIAEVALQQYLDWGFRLPTPHSTLNRIVIEVGPVVLGSNGSVQPGADEAIKLLAKNTLVENEVRLPHELAHKIQYAYNDTSSSIINGLYGAIREGGATFLTESLYSGVNEYVHLAAEPLLGAGATARVGIFPQPERTLLTNVNGNGSLYNHIRYASALLWKYFSEQHRLKTTVNGQTSWHPAETYLEVLNWSDATEFGYAIQAVRRARRKMAWYGRFDVFGRFGNNILGSNETTWGNFLVANYLHRFLAPGDLDYDRRFDYQEDPDPVAYQVPNNDIPPTSSNPSVTALQNAVVDTDSIIINGLSSFSTNNQSLDPFASKYFVVQASGVAGVRIRFNVIGGNPFLDPLVQIIRVGPGDTLVDIHRSDTAVYDKVINLAGLDRVVVIVGSRTQSFNYDLDVDGINSFSDVMITRWNSRVSTEYEIDPINYSWTWVSPDVMVDNGGDGLPDPTVYFGQNNNLMVRLRNRGTTPANNITLQFAYRKASPDLGVIWMPVQDVSGTTQVLSNQSLAPGAEQWFTVDWAPVDDGTSYPHYCVKVEVSSAGDINTDNKLACSNFGNVTTPGPFTVLTGVASAEVFSKILVINRGNPTSLQVEDTFHRPEPEQAVACSPAVFNPQISRMPESFRLVSLSPYTVVPADQMASSEFVVWKKDALDPRALPPVVDPNKLITVVHEVDEVAVGGVTYQLDFRDPEP